MRLLWYFFELNVYKAQPDSREVGITLSGYGLFLVTAMKYNHFLLEKKEYVHLKKVMNFSHHLIQDSYRYALRVLDAKLHSARIWDAQHIPNDVVRLHSNVLLTLDSKEFNYLIISILYCFRVISN